MLWTEGVSILTCLGRPLLLFEHVNTATPNLQCPFFSGLNESCTEQIRKLPESMR